MSNIIKKVSTFLRIGRARFLAGKDLDHNSYYEYPPLDGNTDPRRTRRLVRFREHKELGEYDQSTLPPQWLMWLRHTRKSAPTIEELTKDRERIAITQHNARILEQREAERRFELEQKAQESIKEGQLIEQESYSSSNTQRRDGGRTTTVPTSTVVDSKAKEEAKNRVSFEQQKDEKTTLQHRTVDMEVWEASRRRMEERQGSESIDDAIQTRANRRANLDAKEIERQRARKVMNQSPLSAFDISIEGHTSPQDNAKNQLNSRFGRSTGPGDEWSPSEWQPKPTRR